MLRLGHIGFSNCFPVHAGLIDCGPPAGVELHVGLPSELNRLLADRRIDVAPASSIEFARHADHYRVLPDLVIGARGAVQSILLESDVPPAELHGREVALTTASATSVVLLRLILERRYGVVPRYRWFDQTGGSDPFRSGSAAALWIGDTALQRVGATNRQLIDLGTEWAEWTGLPFAFALWIVSAGPEQDDELRALHGALRESHAYFQERLDTLADRYATTFGIPAERLASYWRSLDFRLDHDMVRGLMQFYRLAAELDEAPPVPSLVYV
ncbi:MAG TPA: menaquinone biosynthesis protein [Longimicrobiales bacterium]|nr:menaquinone biosynthesis protein [Longimicrobiales bacterium]